MSLDDEIDRLKRVPILSTMNYEALRLLAFASDACSFEAGETIFEKGAPADGGYIITSGTVVIDGGTAGEGEGARRTLSTGALLGEQALLSAARRPVTARAEEPVTAIKISRKLIARVLQEYPANAMAIREAWAHKLGVRMRRVKDGGRP